MTKEEYIRELRARISHLPKEEQESVNGARRTQLDNIQIMQIIHNKIRNIRIRRMPVWVRHINVCTHYCE